MRWSFVLAAAVVVSVFAWLIVSMTRGVERPLPQHVAEPSSQPRSQPILPANPSASSASAFSASDPPGGRGSAAVDEPPASLAVAVPGQLDLGWLRTRLPHNRYWDLGVPTDDVNVAAARADAARRQNELYGKILSGTGTDEDIASYFDDRRSLLTDYAEVARVALDEGGDQLSERDRNLFQLALKMDRDRLDALPRERDDAIARKRAQEQRRAEWKGGQ
jgi:hypothetical protein